MQRIAGLPIEVIPSRPTSRKSALRVFPALAFGLLGAAACGSSGSKADAGVMGGTGALLPLTVGNSWVYQVTKTDGTLSTKVSSIAANEAVGGDGPYKDVVAFRFVNGDKVDDPNGDPSWQAMDGDRVVRYRELSVGQSSGNLKHENTWDPPRLRIDGSPEHVVTGANWEETYVETDHDIDTDADGGTFTPDGGIVMADVHELWSVVSENEIVKVPAGEFNALVVRRVLTPSGSIKNYWFSRGVGKVKETDETGGTEELVSYSVTP